MCQRVNAQLKRRGGRSGIRCGCIPTGRYGRRVRPNAARGAETYLPAQRATQSQNATVITQQKGPSLAAAALRKTARIEAWPAAIGRRARRQRCTTQKAPRKDCARAPRAAGVREPPGRAEAPLSSGPCTRPTQRNGFEPERRPPAAHRSAAASSRNAPIGGRRAREK